MTDTIRGLWVALATPLDAEGSVDQRTLTRHAHWVLDQGCDGIVLFGTTGEGTSFTAAERLHAAQSLLGAGIDATRIGLATGYPAVGDTVALTRGALGLGLRHALLLPPYFYRDVSAQGIEDAFAAVLDGVADSRLRATLYHIPQVSGVAVPPEVVARLRARYGQVLAGVKDSSGDFAHFQAFRAAAPDVAVAIGNEADLHRALAQGGVGTICGLGNLVPRMVRAMFTDPDAASPMHAACAAMVGPFVPALKAAMAALTDEPGWARVRPPLRPAEVVTGHQIAATLRGLMVAAAA